MVLAPLKPVSFGQNEVVVTLSPGRTDHGHTGLGFWDEQGQARVYHLDGHRRICLEAVEDTRGAWLFEPVPIPSTALKQLAVYIRAVVKSLCQQGGLVDYGIDFIAARGSFAANGDYTPPAHSTGLTCSSFVVEVLRGFHLNIIDETTWKPSADNTAWANDLSNVFVMAASSCRLLGNQQLADEYEERARVIAAVAPNGLRLLPTEVAGAIAMSHPAWPICYEDAQGPAQVARTALSDAIRATMSAANP